LAVAHSKQDRRTCTSAQAPRPARRHGRNIFAVGLTDHELCVGYSYVDAGIPIRWRIVANGATPLHGEFVSEGGSTLHYVHLLISAQLARDAPARISFDWTRGDTPFAYSVTRTPVDADINADHIECDHVVAPSW
jgi:hypothetical protein